MDAGPTVDPTPNQVAGERKRPYAACLAFGITVIAVAAVWSHTLRQPDHVGYGVYHYSEWLINYAGGFARRGLAGEIIHRLAEGGPATRIVNRLVMAIFVVFSCGLAVLLALTTRRASVVAVVLLVPGGVLAMAIGNDYYYRKEMLFHAHLVVVALLASMLPAVATMRIRKALFAALLMLVSVGVAVLPWVHEAFIFLSLPAHLIVLHLAARHVGIRVGGMIAGLVALSVVIFIVSALFKGSPETARAIWQSLHLVDRTFINPADPSTIVSGGVGAIAWSVGRAQGEVALMLITGYAWFWIPPFLLVSACAWLVTRLVVEERRLPLDAAWHYLDRYLLLVLVTLPLFLLAVDWGRWISSGFIGYIVVLLTRLRLEMVEGRQLAPGQGGEAWSLMLVRAVPRFLLAFAVPLALVTSLLVKMPECCIGGYDRTLLNELKRIIKGS